jgi:hypothetical protein
MHSTKSGRLPVRRSLDCGLLRTMYTFNIKSTKWGTKLKGFRGKYYEATAQKGSNQSCRGGAPGSSGRRLLGSMASRENKRTELGTQKPDSGRLYQSRGPRRFRTYNLDRSSESFKKERRREDMKYLLNSKITAFTWDTGQ